MTKNLEIWRQYCMNIQEVTVLFMMVLIYRLCCAMVWYNVVWCGVVWYGIVWCGLV